MFLMVDLEFQGNKCDKRVKVIVAMCGDAIVKRPSRKNSVFGKSGGGALRGCCWFVCLFDDFFVQRTNKSEQKGESPENIGYLEGFFGGEGWVGGGYVNGFIIDGCDDRW